MFPKLDTIMKLGEWWPGIDRMDKLGGWTYNQLCYAITDVKKDLKRLGVVVR